MQEVGRYRIVRTIGRGGMAEVLEAVALGASGFERRVAIKRMLPEQAQDAAFGRMFLDEARIASQLHHANIAAVLDYGVSDGLPFQVLEFVDGLDAGRLLELGRAAEKPLPIEATLAVVLEVAHALEHAHGATDERGARLGIVHRDVSPPNILVGWSGDVKLSDFGIAFARNRAEHTRAGVAKGTLLYMAPEQILRGEVDGRTDLFGLGCVLHELAAGASPLAGDSAMADLIAGGELRLADDLPDDVRAIVARATRLSRKDRYESARHMGDVIAGALSARAHRDVRTILREWLAQVRPRPAPAAGRGKPAGLLDLEMVLEGQGDVREFSVRPSASLDAVAELPPPEEPAVAFVETEVHRVPRRRPVVLWIAAAAVLLTLGFLGFAALTRGGAGREEPPPAPVAVIDAGHAVVVVSAPPDAAPAPPPVPPVSPPSAPVSRPRPVHAVASSAALPSTATGTVAIGGDGALRAEIFVDGVSRGFAPRLLELPVGDRAVSLRLPDGRSLGPRTLHVTADRTPSAPLRWTVP